MSNPNDPRFDCWALVDDDAALEAALGRDEWQQRREQGFEEACVRFVLKRFDLDPARVRREAIDQLDRSELSFGMFHEVWPTFPVALASADVTAADVLATLSGLDKRFTKTPLYVRYEEVAEAVFGAAEPGALALIFRAGSTLTALHNCLYAFDEEPGVRTVKTLARRSVFVLEPLRQLLEHLSRQWAPD